MKWLEINSKTSFAIGVTTLMMTCGYLLHKQRQPSNISLSAITQTQSPVNIIHAFIDPKKFPGERKHVLGVVDSFKTASARDGIAVEEHEWDLSRPQNTPEMGPTSLPVFATFLQELRTEAAAAKVAKRKIVIYATNTNGVAIFNKIFEAAPDLKDEIISVWGGHQYVPELLTLSGKVDVIALPRTSLEILTSQQRDALNNLGAMLVENMHGVPHNITKELVRAKFANWQDWQQELLEYNIPIDKPIVLVVLGGNAPTPSGVMQEFTIAEAQIFAEQVAKKAHRVNQSDLEAVVIITDHPRTGKGVKDAFLKVLADNYVPYVFFPYTVADINKESAYLPLLGAVTLPDVRLRMAYITGESTSMVSEMAAVIPSVHLTIVQVGSMNEAHLAHMRRDMIEAGCAQGLTLMPEVEHIKVDHTHEPASAADVVVGTIKSLLQMKVESVAKLQP